MGLLLVGSQTATASFIEKEGDDVFVFVFVKNENCVAYEYEHTDGERGTMWRQ